MSLEPKKKGFLPRAVRRIFRRKGNKNSAKDEAESSRMSNSLKSRSTSELLVSEDDQRSRTSNNSSHNLGSGLSMSHDSVFSPEHTGDPDDIRNAQSIQNLAMQELVDRLQPHRDSDEDDMGLPRSPCTSPTTAEVLRQGLHATSGKSRSTCSDGSLLSMGSSENDEDSLGLPYVRQPKLTGRGDLGEEAEDGASFPLSHKAAHHKLSVRPKRTHAVGRHRKLQQLTVASLPATPEDIEETTGNSPDRSWPSMGEREAAGSSGSISRASSAMSTSDSAGSLTASPTRKKVLPNPQEGIEFPVRSRSSGAEWKFRHDSDMLNRRRTVSESPSREFDSKVRDPTETDMGHNVISMDNSERLRNSAPWGDLSARDIHVSPGRKPESGKDVRQVSPIRKPRAASPLQPDLNRVSQCRTESWATRQYDSNTPVNLRDGRSVSPVRPYTKPTLPLSPHHLQKSSDATSPAASTAQSPSEPVATNGMPDDLTSIRRSAQRDPSYRVAVHDRSWEDLETSIKAGKAKKKDDSPSIFSFGSKGKKSGDSIKEKAKDKKEEKEKAKEEKEKAKEEKEKAKKVEKEKKEDDTPFFSRFWGSRRSNRKKPTKDKADDEEEISTAPSQERSTSVIKELSEGTVDVKAMIQNITARSSFSSGSPHSKERDSKPLPITKPRASSSASSNSGSSLPGETNHYSKSLESLSGPRSLDSVVPVNVDTTPSGSRTRLSGSMPRLDGSSLKLSQPKRDNSGDSLDLDSPTSNANVLMVEGEAVPLRRKLSASKEDKSKSSSNRQSGSEQTEPKRSSKRGSILSWYKKDNTTEQHKPEVMPPDGKRNSGQKTTPAIAVTPVTKKPPAADSKSPLPRSQELASRPESVKDRISGSWSMGGESSRPGSRFDDSKSDWKKPSPETTSGSLMKLRGSLQSSPERGSGRSSPGDKLKSEPLHSSGGRSQRSSLTRTPSPEKLPKAGVVPEFMRVQLNRVKSDEAEQKEPNRISSHFDEGVDVGGRRKSSSSMNQEQTPPSRESSFYARAKSDDKGLNRQRGNEGTSPKIVEPAKRSTTTNETPESTPRIATVSPVRTSFRSKTPEGKDTHKAELSPAPEKGEQTSKFSRLTPSKKTEGEPELMKVFHRRSLKIKDRGGDSNEKQLQVQSGPEETPTKPTAAKKEYLESEIGPSSDVEENEVTCVTPTTPKVMVTRSPASRTLSSSPSVQQEKPVSGMADKRSISLCQEITPTSRPRTTSSPGTTMPATSVEIVSKNGEEVDANMPEWRRLAQQRREQREMRERQHVVPSTNGHSDSSMILQSPPKLSGRSKVLDMVSNFQKLQVS